MKIEIAHDTPQAKQFLSWLRDQGHDASIGNSTGNYIDGEWTSSDEDANRIMNDLWEDFCRQ